MFFLPPRLVESMTSTTARILAVLLFAVVPARAQTATGSIFGDVTDPSRAVVSGITVRVAGTGTGTVFEKQTNRDGTYQFAGLPPSQYVVTVEAPGFRTMTRSVVLPIQGRIRVDFQLDLGAVSDVVTVSERTALLQPDSIVQTEIESRHIRELPIKNTSLARI